MAGPGTLRPDRTFLGLALATILAGTALAMVRLGEPSLWLDESYTWWFTRLSWGDLLEATRIDAVNPPLFYLHVKLFAPGSSEAALRIPSVMAHAAGVGLAIALGWLVAGRVGGLTAGVVWATHPLTLWAARDARPYALAAALGVGAAAAFFATRERPSGRITAAAVGLLGLGLLTHYFFFALACALVALAALDLRSNPAFFRRWTILTIVALLPLLAWLGFFFTQGAPSLGIGWIRTPALSDMPLTLWNLASGYAGVADPVSTLCGIAVVGLVALAFVGSERRLALQTLLGGLLLPVVAVWLISQRRPVYVDRYFIVLMPLVLALAATGASRLAALASDRGRLYTAGLIACGLALAAASGLSVLRGPKFEKEDWRGLVAFLQAKGAVIDDTSLSEPEITLPLSYYGFASLEADLPDLIPSCGETCWWVMRQPYTATHALTQAVTEDGRSPRPEARPSCDATNMFLSLTGVQARELKCSD